MKATQIVVVVCSSIERHCIKHTFYLENCGDREAAISSWDTNTLTKNRQRLNVEMKRCAKNDSKKKEMFEQPQMLVNKRYFEAVMETERVPSSVER